MNNETPGREPVNSVVLDVEDAREVGPIEAAGLLRECLALFNKRFEGAVRKALERLQSGMREVEDAPSLALGERLDPKIARAVRSECAHFFPRFRAEFDQLFQARRNGKPRTRKARESASASLALVGDGELKDQVALKNAVRAMSRATREGDFGFDLRVGVVMRNGSTAGDLDNPWSADYVCDALGVTARALWSEDNLWRPIMLHLVKALTPDLAALHRELDRFLRERDVLPVLRVRTRARGGTATSPAPGAAQLYSKLIEALEFGAAARDPSGPQARDTMVGGSPGGTSPVPGDAVQGHGAGTMSGSALEAFPAITSWATLIDALTQLERGQSRVPGFADLREADAIALREGTANELPVLQTAMPSRDETSLDQITIEILSAVLDEVFDNPYLPAEIKTVFGRLQISLLKAALLDPGVLSERRNPVRLFFDTLAAASVGVRSANTEDVRFVQLAGQLAQHVRDRFTDNLDVFEKARGELEDFLDVERAAYNQQLAQSLPSLIALDEYAAAKAHARTALALRVAGRNLPAEIRAFLDHEALDRLTAAYQQSGDDGGAWTNELQALDDLLWSIAPDSKPGARKRLLQLVPALVRTVSEGWPDDESARTRRKEFLTRLYELHVTAIQAPPDLSGADGKRPATSVILAAPLPAPRDAGDDVDEVDALTHGDWCVFADDEAGTPVLAKFAWRAPNGTQLLFTHRDGSIAFVYSPQGLARVFHSGSAHVAVEAVPLFQRAMERLLARRASAADAARSPQ